MRREWLILAAVTLSFFFLNAATFTSLGVALYTMVADLHWSHTAAGFSFSLLGIACGLSSPLPALLMKRIGPRWTIVLGGVMLTVGFVLSAITQSLLSFYFAMVLLGVGYSLAGNVPGVFVVASWFPHKAPRMIGVYLMGGAFGSVIGPPLVQGIVAASGSWRAHWMAMALAAAVIGAICALFIRDQVAEPAGSDPPKKGSTTVSGWTYREAIGTPQFILVAAAMTLTMACVTTIHSVAVAHLTNLGATQAFAAIALSIMALVTTVSKGLAGPLCEQLPARLILASGAILQAIGVCIFATADSSSSTYAFAVIFGVGWGLAYLAASVLLLEYFGTNVGSQVLAAVWLLTTLAAAGPLICGAIADHFGTFGPIFYGYAALLVVIAVPIATLGRPATLVARGASA